MLGKQCNSRALPEGFKSPLAVGNNLVLGQEGVAKDGHGIALGAEVAAQFHIESNLQPGNGISSGPAYATPLPKGLA